MDFKSHLQPLQHFWNDRDEDEDLEDAHEAHADDDHPQLVGVVPENGWPHESVAKAHSIDSHHKLGLSRSMLKEVWVQQAHHQVEQALSCEQVPNLIFFHALLMDQLRCDEAYIVNEGKGADKASSQCEETALITEKRSP